MHEFGDLRLRDWRECGHHPKFFHPSVCVEKLTPLRPELQTDFVGRLDRTPHDEWTEDGWGHWVSIAVVTLDQLDRLEREFEAFRHVFREPHSVPA